MRSWATGCGCRATGGSSDAVAGGLGAQRVDRVVIIVNAPGLIDAAYRGELKAVLVHTDRAAEYTVHRGDRIAQLGVQRAEPVAWNVVETLGGVDRGGGFGHTGR